MKPILTAAEMTAADERAQHEVGMETLIGRAGFAVATRAFAMLGGAYGRRIVVLAGRGHNGDDGRVAAAQLRRRGALVEELPPSPVDETVIEADLVIDAAYGTGFHGEYRAPQIAPGTPVLAVDLPSGLDADTGVASGGVVANETVTFAALKPGLLVGDGPARSGAVHVADIGLDLGASRQFLVDDGDVVLVPKRRREANKWDAAVYVVAGSPGMYGAPNFVASGALRAGAGMVRLAIPGDDRLPIEIAEAVQRELPAGDFAAALVGDLARVRALVIGPGLGTAPETMRAVRATLAAAALPVVLDADGLSAIGAVADAADLLNSRSAPLVLTPHEGEFVRLSGEPLGSDRVGAVRELARAAGAIVLLKGATTLVAAPDGRVLYATAGSPRLATAGTGDVLAGVIGALIARGVEPFLAAALGAHIHGRASEAGPAGLVAGELPALIGAFLGNCSR